ncbi:MAG: SLC13 family permease [Pseudomonadota bacterium]
MKQLINNYFTRALFLLLVITSGWLKLFPPALLNTDQINTAVLCLLVIGLWATTLIPEYITALLFFCIAMLFSIAPPEQVFAGFSSSVFWLVFAGLIIGIAIKKTGLGKHIATLIVTHLKNSYPILISGIVMIGVLFSFLMPSAMARIVLIIPVMLLVASHFGFEKGSNGHTGIILAAFMGAFIPAFSILPANVANMILTGMYETQFGASLLYGEYLLLHFPVLGLLKAMLIIILIVILYPDHIRVIDKSELQSKTQWTKNERFLSILLVVALLFWVSDFLHHISPAWIAMVVAIILLFPKFGIISKKEFNQQIDFATLFFVAGIIGFGVVISHSGLGNIIAENFLKHFPLNPQSTFYNYMLLNISAMLTGVITTLPGVPAVLVPLVEQFSQASGLSEKTVIMTQVVGFSTIIFPYQAPPVLVATRLSGVRLSITFKFCAILALFTIVFLMPINFLWWKFLGWI